MPLTIFCDYIFEKLTVNRSHKYKNKLAIPKIFPIKAQKNVNRVD